MSDCQSVIQELYQKTYDSCCVAMIEDTAESFFTDANHEIRNLIRVLDVDQAAALIYHICRGCYLSFIPKRTRMMYSLDLKDVKIKGLKLELHLWCQDTPHNIKATYESKWWNKKYEDMNSLAGFVRQNQIEWIFTVVNERFKMNFVFENPEDSADNLAFYHFTANGMTTNVWLYDEKFDGKCDQCGRDVSDSDEDDEEDPNFVKPTEPSTETVVEPSTETVVEPSTETVVEPSTETVVEPSTETVVEPSTETVVEPSTETVVEPSNNRNE
jgi:hypothetical protein